MKKVIIPFLLFLLFSNRLYSQENKWIYLDWQQFPKGKMYLYVDSNSIKNISKDTIECLIRHGFGDSLLNEIDTHKPKRYIDYEICKVTINCFTKQLRLREGITYFTNNETESENFDDKQPRDMTERPLDMALYNYVCKQTSK